MMNELQNQKTDRKDISVILPVYNIENTFLKQCFRSLEDQDFAGTAEFLMIDDGSEEYVREICCEFSGKDERFVYIPQEHSGVSAARNNGLRQAKGEFVCFVDPDDWIDRSYLSVLYDLITGNESDMAVIDAVFHNGERSTENHFLDSEETVLRGSEKNRLLYQLVGKKICPYYPPAIAAGVPWAKMFRRDFIVKNDLHYVPDMPRMQDNIFCLYAYEKAESIAYKPTCLYHYRKDTGSVSHRFNPDIIRHFEIYYKETEKFLDQYHKEQILYEALYMKELTSFNSYLTYYFYLLPDKTNAEVSREISGLLKKEPYRTALEHVSRRYLTNSEYIFVIALKYRLFRLLKLLVNARNRVKL